MNNIVSYLIIVLFFWYNRLMNKEKEYIEPEVLKNKDNKESFGKKATGFGKGYASDKATEQMGDMRKAAMMKGGLVLLPYILGIVLFLFLLFGLIFLIFDNPFDYIIAGIIGFFMIRGLFNISKLFGGKK